MLTTWLAVASALTAAAGLVFAAVELRHVRQRRAEDDQLATDGVSVSWSPLAAPDRGGRHGLATWTYEVIAHNPGRFPVSEVEIVWTLPLPVRRVHSSGTVGEETTSLRMVQPVIRGGAERRWKRVLVMDFVVAGDRLEDSKAVITFTDIRRKRHSTEWPRRAADGSLD